MGNGWVEREVGNVERVGGGGGSGEKNGESEKEESVGGSVGCGDQNPKRTHAKAKIPKVR